MKTPTINLRTISANAAALLNELGSTAAAAKYAEYKAQFCTLDTDRIAYRAAALELRNLERRAA